MIFVIDTYTFKARLLPALLVVSPLTAFAILLPDGYSLSLRAGGSVGVGACLLALFSQLGRDQGKKKESWLFQKWGGTPTTLMLSYSKTSLDQVTLRRYHQKLGAIVPGITMPNRQAEENNWAEAANVYNSCVRFLRERTHDKSFRLIRAENANYGFRRNLWSMKPAGAVIAMLGIIISFLGLLFTPAAWITLLIATLLLVFWVLRIRPSWVKIAADEYARVLLASLDRL